MSTRMGYLPTHGSVRRATFPNGCDSGPGEAVPTSSRQYRPLGRRSGLGDYGRACSVIIGRIRYHRGGLRSPTICGAAVSSPEPPWARNEVICA